MKKKNRWWLLITPLYLFTLLFVLGPMIYMVAVSFATNNGDGYGFRWIFTLDNYRKMTDPVYLQCFVQSFELAFATTILVTLIGYPFGYFMAKLSEKRKKRMMFLIMVPFWTSSLIRLYPPQFWIDAAIAVAVLVAAQITLLLVTTWPTKYRKLKAERRRQERQELRVKLASARVGDN